MIDRHAADAALTRLEVDRLGLDAMDRRYLRRIAEHHAGGPVGVETLAAALAEARDTLEDVIEPFLIQEGLVLRTSRGRMLGEPGWRHLESDAARAHARSTRPAARRAQVDLDERQCGRHPPDGRHRYALRVYYEDTDAGGIVYHANYLRFAERARTEALRDLGIPHADLLQRIHFDVRGAAHQSGLSPPGAARQFADVVTEPLAVGGASVLLRQDVRGPAGSCAVLDGAAWPACSPVTSGRDACRSGGERR